MNSQPMFDLSHIPEKPLGVSTVPNARKAVPEETWLQIKELWATGLSASEIARKIGVTRNVVIGLIHRRLGGGTRGTFRTTGIRVYPERSARLARTYVSRPPKPVKAAASSPPPEPPPKAVKADEKTLMEIKYGSHCCFPVGGKGADTVYCGGPTAGQTYCPEHHKIMHVASATTKPSAGVSLASQGYVGDPTKGRGRTAAQAAREAYFGGGKV